MESRGGLSGRDCGLADFVLEVLTTRRGRARIYITFAALMTVLSLNACGRAGPPAIGTSSPVGTYRADDSAQGRALDLLPAGENGLVTARDLTAFNGSGVRPANSVDQMAPYNNLIYGAPSLKDATLTNYYLDESFGVRPKDVTRTERPDPANRVIIYRDRYDIPHVYGTSLDAMAYGAGYAGAEDRLFFMDVVRHYGEGDLMSFVGNSCDYESMDYQSLVSKGYTQRDLQEQIDVMPKRFGKTGTELVSMISAYVAGVNRYIALASKNPDMMPVEYAATGASPAPWKPTDIVAISTLIALEATGGGDEVQNAALFEYLRSHFGAPAATSIFGDMKEQNDPAAPTVIPNRFPYMIGSLVDPSLTALPDKAPTTLSDLAGAPQELSADCTGGPVSHQEQASGGTSASALSQQISREVAGAATVGSGSASHSNAVVVDAAHSAEHHPIAVFGPELGYYDPEILMQEDLHAPGYAAEGAAFPGANFVIELGRGTSYAWSATTASTDQVDMRVEKLCIPGGGTPPSQGTYYEFRGRCTAMTTHTFAESHAGTTLTRTLYYTIHGVVQGWSIVGGAPVAIVRQDATTGHDLDQFAGYLSFGMPAVSSTPDGWMHAASDIAYTFNWFYANSSDIAYYVSGRDPMRDPHVDPNLPTWGTGVAEWSGWLAFGAHPHAIDPRQGYLISWNNKPAPGFSASDDLYAWGPVFRSQLLDDGLKVTLKQHHYKVTRAQLAALVENASTQDLDGYTLVNPVLGLIGPALNATTPVGVDAMVGQLQQWAADGFHRRKLNPQATQYQDAAAVAIWDQVYPGIVEAFFDGVFASGGVESYMGMPDGYAGVPMLFSETPDDVGQHDGDGFYSGWEGYVLKAIAQVQGHAVVAPFSQDLMPQMCGWASYMSENLAAGSPMSQVGLCRSAVLSAFESAYSALVTANGESTDVASWTQDANTQAVATLTGQPETIPEYDQIQFQQAGAIPLPTMDWVNRPTYQQVVEFPG